MSYALPAVVSSKSASGIKNLLINQDFLVYQDEKKFVNQILQLKDDKILAEKISKNSHIKIKNLSWEKTLKNYNKII